MFLELLEFGTTTIDCWLRPLLLVTSTVQRMYVAKSEERPVRILLNSSSSGRLGRRVWLPRFRPTCESLPGWRCVARRLFCLPCHHLIIQSLDAVCPMGHVTHLWYSVRRPVFKSKVTSCFKNWIAHLHVIWHMIHTYVRIISTVLTYFLSWG